MQYTVARGANIVFEGRALHTGVDTWARVVPAPPNTGVVFRRIDIESASNLIPARLDLVVATDYCTKIANESGAAVSTVEHLLAALYCCGIHNAYIELRGPEVPNMDGSAKVFVDRFRNAGKLAQDVPAKVLKILKPVEVANGETFARLQPSEVPEMEFTISYPELEIGNQFKKLELKNGNIANELSECRTFCTTKDIFQLWSMNKALGGTLETTLVVSEQGVLTPNGMRMPDECVGHKMLDAIGDLSLSGGVISGKFIGHLSGHALTIRLLRKLFSTNGAWQFMEADQDFASDLPGEGMLFNSN
ncbi:MAG: UDP-3-O-acyl-N-acetylglucosamine deacetylase [Albidovulum sp.]|nr:UDP-3-O-acyl-N-acetylglucosamine deacetylase [Albidovulum sp.]